MAVTNGISCVIDLSTHSKEFRKWKYPYDDAEVGQSQIQNRRELCITIRVFYHVLVGLLLLSMVIICTICISHLQQNVQRLDREVNDLRKLVSVLCMVT